ncbi:MAG: hypothetical protein CSA18_05210 [Deltaproteobacteria bacterium]|nr:MAG: hypothetical protein CSA18_05210 [Deltaproteobacteria bacterium]
MPNTTPGAAAPFLRSGCLASSILMVVRKLVRGNENQMVIKLGGGFRMTKLSQQRTMKAM